METRKTDGTVIVDISFPEIEKFDRLPSPEADGVSAFVSIMEGCSKYCTFCVVPYTRGEEVSRPMADVLAEITALSEQGVREVNLLGQNVNAFRGEMPDGSICDFAELLPYVADIDGIDRIRYTTSHPVITIILTKPNSVWSVREPARFFNWAAWSPLRSPALI